MCKMLLEIPERWGGGGSYLNCSLRCKGMDIFSSNAVSINFS